jgi:hypothetical protein
VDCHVTGDRTDGGASEEHAFVRVIAAVNILVTFALMVDLLLGGYKG